VLASDGRVFGVRDGNALEVPPDATGSSAVRCLSRDVLDVALVRRDGALLVAGGGPCDPRTSRWSMERMMRPQPATGLCFSRIELGGEPVTRAVAGNGWMYALTEAGSIWAWGISWLGFGHEQFCRRPYPVSVVVVDGRMRAAPPFALMSVNSDSLCAVDRAGRLFACGRCFVEAVFGESSHRRVGLLTAMPQPPVPIRDVLAGLDGQPCGYRLRKPASARCFGTSGTVRVGDGPCVGPLALLVDGTVWSVVGRVRLPLPPGVVRFGVWDRRTKARLRVMDWTGHGLTATPAELLRLALRT
jgi:hypothetical protein